MSKPDIAQCGMSSRGFTLIEIMVALAVLALSGIALLNNVNQATRDFSVLRDKSSALGIAEYTLNSVLLEPDFPDTGSQEDVVLVGNREWRVQVEISETPNEKVRRIDVTLQPGDATERERQIATVLLSGFVAKLD